MTIYFSMTSYVVQARHDHPNPNLASAATAAVNTTNSSWHCGAYLQQQSIEIYANHS
jgi:hypothetical protein